jgi:hypothetical protein
MLIGIAAGLLIFGILVAEVPELLSLMDNTSNDFTIRKAAHVECAATPGIAAERPLPFDVNKWKRDGWAWSADSVVRAGMPPDLLTLYSVLRT